VGWLYGFFGSCVGDRFAAPGLTMLEASEVALHASVALAAVFLAKLDAHIIVMLFCL
jgi:hypothetical protein